jgi:thiol-disulfide isomerase/thioredoxin
VTVARRTAPPARSDCLTNLVLADIDGNQVTLADSSCSLLLLDFWATWCQPCVRAMPHLQELHRRYSHCGLKVLGLTDSSGNPAAAAAQARQLRDLIGVEYPLLVDDGRGAALRRRLQVQLYPTLILLDRQGNLLWRSEGLDQGRLQQLEAILQRHLQPGQAAAISSW